MKRFAAEVELIKKLYNSAWEKNWGFVPLTNAEIDHLAKQLKPSCRAGPRHFRRTWQRGRGVRGEPPRFQSRAAAQPLGPDVPGILKVLWLLPQDSPPPASCCSVVIPEFRGRAIDAVLYHRTWENSVKHGMPRGEAGWILEDNALMNKAATELGFRVSKTYRVYDKPL